MSFLRKMLCVSVGHTWDRVMVRTDQGTKTIGYQCHHCGTFRPYRPDGILDRHFE